MTLTTIDPTTALLVVDLQKGIAGLPAVHPISDVAGNAGLLAHAFRDHGLPVVLITVAGVAAGRTERSRGTGTGTGTGTDLLPELDQQDSDHEIVKKTWGAFTGTGLDELLTNLGVTQVVLAGVATSVGVESTARHAHEHGYHVTLAVDAMTDLSPEAHENSVTRIFPALGETATTAEITGRLPARRG